MLSEKLARTLSETQLRQLIKMQGAKANKSISQLGKLYKPKNAPDNAKPVEIKELSGVFAIKTEPYLKKHGTTAGGFKLTPAKDATKQELIDELLNIQYYNEKIGTPAQIIARAERTANDYGVDITDTAEYWRLVRKGLNSTGFKIDSGSVEKIVAERMRAGKTERGIAISIGMAAKKADNGTDFITRFSGGGKWLV